MAGLSATSNDAVHTGLSSMHKHATPSLPCFDVGCTTVALSIAPDGKGWPAGRHRGASSGAHEDSLQTSLAEWRLALGLGEVVLQNCQSVCPPAFRALQIHIVMFRQVQVS